MSSVLLGFVTGLSLIVAIGAQNAFVLRQGLGRQHVLPIVLLCAASDAALIAAGIAGLGAVLTAQPWAVEAARYGGGAFVLGYGLMAARRALRPNGMTARGRTSSTLKTEVLTCLGFTFLNPHVYLDTVILLGALANQHGAGGRWWYGAGSAAGSLSWFFALGFGARTLSRFFESPRSWQVLDAAIAAVMLTLGAVLVLG